MDKKKRDYILYQWLFITPFSVLAALGALIVAVMAILIFAASAKYIVASFALDGAKIFPAFVLSVLSLGVVAALVFSEVLLIKKYVKSVKEFVAEKKGLGK